MGIDIIEIEEIKNSFEKSKRFRDRVFTEQEIAFCESKINKYESYAARFAAKEAVMKALSTGWDKGVQWKQIEVVRGDGSPEAGVLGEVNGEQLTVNGDENWEGNWDSGMGNQYGRAGGQMSNALRPMTNNQSGKPEIRLYGKALELSKEMKVENVFLSLSHSRKYAVANVIFEGNEMKIKR